jgi:hypothetical protein
MKQPKLKLDSFQKDRIYNRINFNTLINSGMPTNYYSLTPDQKDFISDLVDGVMEEVKSKINDYNDERYFAEKDEIKIEL